MGLFPRLMNVAAAVAAEVSGAANGNIAGAAGIAAGEVRSMAGPIAAEADFQNTVPGDQAPAVAMSLAAVQQIWPVVVVVEAFCGALLPREAAAVASLALSSLAVVATALAKRWPSS